jgi:hypothetical protein
MQAHRVTSRLTNAEPVNSTSTQAELDNLKDACIELQALKLRLPERNGFGTSCDHQLYQLGLSINKFFKSCGYDVNTKCLSVSQLASLSELQKTVKALIDTTKHEVRQQDIIKKFEAVFPSTYIYPEHLDAQDIKIWKLRHDTRSLYEDMYGLSQQLSKSSSSSTAKRKLLSEIENVEKQRQVLRDACRDNFGDLHQYIFCSSRPLAEDTMSEVERRLEPLSELRTLTTERALEAHFSLNTQNYLEDLNKEIRRFLDSENSV